MAQETVQRKRGSVKKPASNTYDKYKEFQGERYTGMKVGKSHKWYYDKGEWKEKKTDPDEWHFTYSADKRRAGNAPEGSGAPVGTEYHWYIVANQTVKKMDANRYPTSMTGVKYKVAHRRAGKESWNITERGQKRRLIQLLERSANQLRNELDVPIPSQ